jgi:hypothetical protein
MKEKADMHCRSLLFVLPLCLFPAAWSDAGPLQATAQAERTTVQRGQPVRVTVIVRNSDGPPEIQVPKGDEFTVGPAGPAASQPSMLAGVEPLTPGGPIPGKKLIDAMRETADKAATAPIDPTTAKQLQDQGLMDEYRKALADLKKDDYAVTYVVQPTRTGAVRLPAFTVKSGTQTATTQPIGLTVTDPLPQGWVRLKLSLSNPRPMPGDEVQLYVDTLIRRGPVTLARKEYPHFPVRDVTLSVPTPEGGPLELARPLAQVLRDRAAQPGHHGFHVNNVPGEYVPDHEPADLPKDERDPEWYRRRLTVSLVVRDAGKVVIPPAKIAGEVYSGGRWVPFTASSEPLTVTSRELANKPPDFTGGVGIFKLTARASQTTMPAGTPFVFTLRQEGRGNLARATPPDLNTRPGFADRFAIHLEGDRLLEDGVREFSYTLRARSEKVTEIPSVSVSSYDPKEDRYETAKSDPIPLRVTPAPPAGAAPAPAAPDLPGISAKDVIPEKLAEQPNPSSLDRLRPWREFVNGLALLLIFITLCYVAWRYRWFGERRVPAVRPRQVMDAARLRLHAPHLTVADVRRALQDFLRARFNLPPGEVTPKDAEDCLRQSGYGEQLAHECADVLSGCDAAEYAPGLARPAAELAALADGVIRSILETTPAPIVATVATVDELTRERAAAVAG